MLWKNFKHKRSEKSESGQALIEFVLGLMIVFSFFFFYVKMAAVFAVGNYIHYATFMSARAYMASATSEATQRENAETMLKKMVGNRFKTIVTPFECPSGCAESTMTSVTGGRVGKGPFAQENIAAEFWNTGVSYSFKAKLSIFPWNREGDALNMKLVSESWMPREESETECGDHREKIRAAIPVQNARLEWDNGC